MLGYDSFFFFFFFFKATGHQWHIGATPFLGETSTRIFGVGDTIPLPSNCLLTQYKYLYEYAFFIHIHIIAVKISSMLDMYELTLSP